MTKRDILSIAFKIISVVVLIKAIGYIPMVIVSLSMFLSHSMPEIKSPLYLIASFMSPILMLTIALLLLKFADTLAQKLISHDKELPTIDPLQWQKPLFGISLKIIGVICFIKGIPHLMNAFINSILNSNPSPISIKFSPTSGIPGSTIYLVLGLYLFFGGKTIVNLAFKNKNGRMKDNELE